MASSPITSWQIDGETVETVTGFIFLDSKITADDDCSHEIKRRLLLGRKAITNLDSILKSRDITLLTKVCLIRAMVFSVVMYGCESWTVKKFEHWRINAFKLYHKLPYVQAGFRKGRGTRDQITNIHWIFKMKYYSTIKVNKILLFAAIWMDLEKIRGEGNGTPLQYSCLENLMDRGAW